MSQLSPRQPNLGTPSGLGSQGRAKGEKGEKGEGQVLPFAYDAGSGDHRRALLCSAIPARAASQCVSIKEQAMGQLDRITQAPEIMGGKACIRGLRVTVSKIGRAAGRERGGR